MKLLFDQNISYRIIKKLDRIFELSEHISTLGLTDYDDIEIWKFAKENGFTIVTFDADFYEISLLNGLPPKIIWIRSGNLTTVGIIDLLNDNHLLISEFIVDRNNNYQTCLEIFKTKNDQQ